jgi:hypothetical protein
MCSKNTKTIFGDFPKPFPKNRMQNFQTQLLKTYIKFSVCVTAISTINDGSLSFFSSIISLALYNILYYIFISLLLLIHESKLIPFICFTYSNLSFH